MKVLAVVTAGTRNGASYHKPRNSGGKPPAVADTLMADCRRLPH